MTTHDSNLHAGNGSGDPLWCPLLTHYCVRDGRCTVDRRRMAAQMRTLAPHVRQFLLAGSTGDGWDLDARQFDDLLSFATHAPYWAPGARFLVGALGPRTIDVLRRGQAIRTKLADTAAPGFIGIAVCPPVRRGATQELIRTHFASIADGLGLPMAVYQLPSVTQCEIEPATMAALAAEHRNIRMFKDSSGTDAVARAHADGNGLLLVRGAEGDYADALRACGGPYDGLLLSTCNVLYRPLRALVDRLASGRQDAARRESDRLTKLVQRLFEAAAGCATGNPYSNVNRAVDHLLAHGAHWQRVEPPMLADGGRLSHDVLAEVAAIYDEQESIPQRGYFVHRDAAHAWT